MTKTERKMLVAIAMATGTLLEYTLTGVRSEAQMRDALERLGKSLSAYAKEEKELLSK